MDIGTSEGLAHVELTWPAAGLSAAGGPSAGGPAAGPPGAEVPGAEVPGPEVAGGEQVRAGRPAFLLALTHGAGGGVDAPDLRAARAAALRLGGAVAMVTQPYRVKGRRAPGSAARQDAAWVEIIAVLRETVLRETVQHQAAGTSAEGGRGIPLIQGGRSNGARVACRTARTVGARAVVALAFPVHPPGRPERSRLAELREAGPEVLVVNGDRDPFGIPGDADAARVVVLAGESHTLSRSTGAIADAVGSWLRDVLGAAR